jgi:hypothetical protein
LLDATNAWNEIQDCYNVRLEVLTDFTLNRVAICPSKLAINFYQTPWHHITEESLDTEFSKFQLSTVSITTTNS